MAVRGGLGSEGWSKKSLKDSAELQDEHTLRRSVSGYFFPSELRRGPRLKTWLAR